MVRLGLIEIVPETVACLEERMRVCSEEDPATCGPLFRPRTAPVEGGACRHDVECGEAMRCDGVEPRFILEGPDFCTVGRCVPRTPDGGACSLRPGVTARPIGQCQSSSVCIDEICVPVVGSEVAAIGDACGFVAEGSGALHRSCGSGRCALESVVGGRCVIAADIGEACEQGAGCALDATCFEGHCVARPVWGDPCEEDGSWCSREAFGTTCMDGVCVPNPRRLGDSCEAHYLQPCTEGVCASSEETHEMICQTSLRSPPGGPCRRVDADCLGGVCCAGVCVSLGGPVLTSSDESP